MNTKKIIIGLFIILVLLVLIVLVIRRKKPSTVVMPTSTPTPNQILTPTLGVSNIPTELDVASVSPINSAVNVESGTQIVITFNRAIRNGEIKLYMDPAVPRTEKVVGNKLFAIPKTKLTSGVTYQYSIYFYAAPAKSRRYSFTVEGPTPADYHSADTRDEEAITQESQLELQKYPDIFLNNQLPYETTTFSANSSYKKDTEQFVYTVTAKGDKEKAKTDFIVWIKSLGMRDDQIATLNIQYQ